MAAAVTVVDNLKLLETSFKPFADAVKTRSDNDFFYVESAGMPDHQIMVGITAWQQQVPLPQTYTGANAWRIPRQPVPAKQPMSAKTGFFRGAIAIAVNGVPIFNPIKNDGRTDTLLAGSSMNLADTVVARTTTIITSRPYICRSRLRRSACRLALMGTRSMATRTKRPPTLRRSISGMATVARTAATTIMPQRHIHI
jgi:hypothetical protein